MITYGKRIKYERVMSEPDKELYQSRTIFTDGEKAIRVVVDKDRLQFKFVDPATGHLHFQSALNVTNYEVLQRHVKRQLIRILGIKFSKETRNVNGTEE